MGAVLSLSSQIGHGQTPRMPTAALCMHVPSEILILEGVSHPESWALLPETDGG